MCHLYPRTLKARHCLKKMSAVPAEEYCVNSKSTFNASTNWRQTDEGTSRGVSWSCVVHLPEYEIGVFSLLHRVSQLQWKTKLPSNKPLQLHLPGFPLMAHTYPLERHLPNTFRDLMQNKNRRSGSKRYRSSEALVLSRGCEHPRRPHLTVFSFDYYNYQDLT